MHLLFVAQVTLMSTSFTWRSPVHCIPPTKWMFEPSVCESGWADTNHGNAIIIEIRNHHWNTAQEYHAIINEIHAVEPETIRWNTSTLKTMRQAQKSELKAESQNNAHESRNIPVPSKSPTRFRRQPSWHGPHKSVQNPACYPSTTWRYPTCHPNKSLNPQIPNSQEELRESYRKDRD